ncbi:unannotated protein [freshwater metagenome]|uniref:Unannotated protein n=1 Tax=freshwater metagenome TaxID=449393 RepID=A0A6J7PGS1_9ZZZZ
MLRRIIVRVFLANCNASITLAKPEFINVISALEIAVSVPVPIAIDKSAAVRAAASLIPSPIINTHRPSDFNRSTICNLVSGSAADTTCAESIPTAAATPAATSALSPVTNHGVIPNCVRAVIVCAASSFN